MATVGWRTAARLKRIPPGSDQNFMSSSERLPVKAGPVPDKLTIWPVDDGRYASTPPSRARRVTQRAEQHQRELERRGVPYSFRQELGADGRFALDRSGPSMWRLPCRRSCTEFPGGNAWCGNRRTLGRADACSWMLERGHPVYRLVTKGIVRSVPLYMAKAVVARRAALAEAGRARRRARSTIRRGNGGAACLRCAGSRTAFFGA